MGVSALEPSDRSFPQVLGRPDQTPGGVGTGARGDMKESLKTGGLRGPHRVRRHLTGGHYPEIRDQARRPAR